MQAKHSGQQLLSLVNDILDISKIEAKKLVIDHSDFQLPQLLDNCIAPIAILAEQKGLEFQYQSIDTLPVWVRGDALRITQVINNLLGNAIKFTETGSISVNVSLIERDAGAVFKFSVSDSGIGINEQKLSAIFEAFNQADNSTTRRFGGTGLGLTLSKQLIEKMAGKLEVNSEEGVGSTFSFAIPLEVINGIANKPVSSSSTTTKNITRCAIIDDLESSRTYLSLITEQLGLSADVFANGQVFLEQSQGYPLVILDYHMPVIDGVELARKIKQGSSEQPYLILISAAADCSDINLADKQMFNYIFPKPIDKDALTQALTEIMTGTAKSAKIEQSPLQVLLAEDNDINAQIVEYMLTLEGYLVTRANDGLAAVEQVRENQFDVILMDINMPNMDGWQATQVIRTDLKVETPIIALTANAYEQDKQRSVTVGMQNHLTKPIVKEELFRAIERVI